MLNCAEHVQRLLIHTLKSFYYYFCFRGGYYYLIISLDHEVYRLWCFNAPMHVLQGRGRRQ